MFYLFFFLFACKETIEPTNIWEVEVTGTGSNNPCVSSTEGFQKTYEYGLYYDGNFAEVKIKSENSSDFIFFATGVQSGYAFDYESPIYLEESTNGNFNWQIVGSAYNEKTGEGDGSSNIPDGYDWYGTEILTVVTSANPNVPEGCTYEMEVAGTFVQ